MPSTKFTLSNLVDSCQDKIKFCQSILKQQNLLAEISVEKDPQNENKLCVKWAANEDQQEGLKQHLSAQKKAGKLNSIVIEEIQEQQDTFELIWNISFTVNSNFDYLAQQINHFLSTLLNVIWLAPSIREWQRVWYEAGYLKEHYNIQNGILKKFTWHFESDENTKLFFNCVAQYFPSVEERKQLQPGDFRDNTVEIIWLFEKIDLEHFRKLAQVLDAFNSLEFTEIETKQDGSKNSIEIAKSDKKDQAQPKEKDDRQKKESNKLQSYLVSHNSNPFDPRSLSITTSAQSSENRQKISPNPTKRRKKKKKSGEQGRGSSSSPRAPMQSNTLHTIPATCIKE